MHILSKVLCDFEHYFAICFFIYLLHKPEYWNTSVPPPPLPRNKITTATRKET